MSSEIDASYEGKYTERIHCDGGNFVITVLFLKIFLTFVIRAASKLEEVSVAKMISDN